VAFISQHEKENTTFNGPWVSQSEHKEINDQFKDWEPEVQALIKVSLRILHSWYACKLTTLSISALMSPCDGQFILSNLFPRLCTRESR